MLYQKCCLVFTILFCALGCSSQNVVVILLQVVIFYFGFKLSL